MTIVINIKLVIRDTVFTCLFYNNFCVKSFLNQSHFIRYGVEEEKVSKNNKSSLMPEGGKNDFLEV